MKNEKVIEEFTQDIYQRLPDYEHNERDCRSAAKELFAIGYRKQSKGEWIRHKENCLYNKCSICSYEHCREDNYCPNCGAKMKGESE